MRHVILAVLLSGLLASCNEGAGRIDGPYRLDIVDVTEDANVCYELESGDCVGRIPPTVFAVGYDANFIVAARHPHRFGDRSLDRSQTEYFYIVRSLDGPTSGNSVRGPFDLNTFERHRRTLRLPAFDREIFSLK